MTTASDIADILYMRRSTPLARVVIAKLLDDIESGSLRRYLDVDAFPLSMRQYETLTSRFAEDGMDWDKVKLLLEMGMFVELGEREDAARHIVHTYGDWIVNNGGLGRCVPKSCWARLMSR